MAGLQLKTAPEAIVVPTKEFQGLVDPDHVLLVLVPDQNDHELHDGPVPTVAFAGVKREPWAATSVGADRNP